MSNDFTLMEIPQLRTRLLVFLGVAGDLNIEAKYEEDFYLDLKITKGEFKKVMVKNDYVTFYEFKLWKNGCQTSIITKRYSDF